MGMTYVDIDVASVANPDDSEHVEFLVDSGATYSVVPAAILERLGIKPISEQVFRLADAARFLGARAAPCSSTGIASGWRT